jgi:hypothetical protein
LNARPVLVATNSAPAHYRWSEQMISFSQADQWLRSPQQISVTRRSHDPRRLGKKGACGWWQQHQRHLSPNTPGPGGRDDLTELDTPFFGIVPTKGEYPLGQIYMSVTIGTPENYQTEFQRFEVARFDCGYNAIIGRPGLAKFMAIPHYPYMILKMPGPQGIITVCANFQGAAECFGVPFRRLSLSGPR